MRLFIAVPVPEEVRAAASAAIEALAKTGADFRWVDPRTLHLTLCFLGETPPERLPELEAALDRAARREPFDILWGALGAFPTLESPRIVWIGVAEGRERLQELAAGWPQPDERPWAPHLTLGRQRGRLKLEALKRALAARPPLGVRQRVERIVLYESRLTKEGPVHTERRARPLAL